MMLNSTRGNVDELIAAVDDYRADVLIEDETTSIYV